MSKKFNILIVSDDFFPAATGVGTHIQLIARELTKRGHKISVLTSKRKNEKEVEDWEGVTVYRTFTLKIAGFYQALPSKKTIRLVLNQVRPDIVHYHYLSFLMKWSCDLVTSMRIPQTYTSHMTVDHLTGPFFMRPFRRIISYLIARYCNRFQVIISNPILFDDAVISSKSSNKSFTVLYAGRLDPEKNVSYLLQAFKLFLAHVPDATLWIAGRGSQKEMLEEQVLKLGIQERVQFLGFINHEELKSRYLTCDVFVLPALVEVQPLVAMEAMWFARPVIVTSAILAAEEMVEHGVNGYIVNPSEPNDLASKLLLLSSDPEKRIRFGEASQLRAKAYRPGPVVDALENTYLEVLSKRDKASSPVVY